MQGLLKDRKKEKNRNLGSRGFWSVAFGKEKKNNELAAVLMQEAEQDKRDLALLWRLVDMMKEKSNHTKEVEMREMYAARRSEKITNRQSAEDVWDEAHAENKKRDRAEKSWDKVWADAHRENTRRAQKALEQAIALQKSLKDRVNPQKAK
jgi:hypothetical protein